MKMIVKNILKNEKIQDYKLILMPEYKQIN